LVMHYVKTANLAYQRESGNEWRVFWYLGSLCSILQHLENLHG
jgi:hypothetical protein